MDNYVSFPHSFHIKNGVINILFIEYLSSDMLRYLHIKTWHGAFEEGEQNKLISLVQKKLAKGKSIEEIADALEESVETVKSIIETLQ